MDHLTQTRMAPVPDRREDLGMVFSLQPERGAGNNPEGSGLCRGEEGALYFSGQAIVHPQIWAKYFAGKCKISC